MDWCLPNERIFKGGPKIALFAVMMHGVSCVCVRAGGQAGHIKHYMYHCKMIAQQSSRYKVIRILRQTAAHMVMLLSHANYPAFPYRFYVPQHASVRTY